MNKKETYRQLLPQLAAMVANQDDMITMLANTSALFKMLLPDISWIGYYLSDGHMLTLGPFQGKPACEKIKVGSGVCGSCVVRQQTIIVPDVHQFAGHIACDADTNSEIVVPLWAYGEMFAVLDADSVSLNRFDSDDQQGLLACTKIIQQQALKILKQR
jgi:GAF domain-containing protein